MPQPSGLPEDAGQIRELLAVRCETREQKKTWNTVMGEHYIGALTSPGRLIKYMVVADGQTVAAGYFGSARLFIRDRDEWIGWTAEEQTRSRDIVLIHMGRFLVREEAHGCRNLASMALGAMIGAVREDWPKKYGVRPYLIESFVDPEKFSGTCYRAANWIPVGMTAGRGYDDRKRTASKSRKLIYMYPLVPDFRERLGLPSPEDRKIPAWVRAKPLGVFEGLKGDAWASQEFAGAKVGNKASVKRLVFSAARIAQSPHTLASKAFGADKAAQLGWFRFVDNPRVTPQGILAGHRDCTLMRAKVFRIVLFVMDTMTVSLPGKVKATSLEGDFWVFGYDAHTTIAVEPEQELFLGVVDATFRGRRQGGKGPGRLPPDERESAVWRQHARSVGEVAVHMPGTLSILVGDRGADALLFIHECIELGCVRLVIRARTDLVLPEESEGLFPLMAHTELCGTMKVKLGRTSERRDCAGNAVARAYPETVVEVDVAFRRVTLAPPPEKPEAGPLEVVCVAAVERGKPKRDERVKWILLTTVDVENAEDAMTVVGYYERRWLIEEMHGILKKDCCDIESLAYRTFARLVNVHAVYMAVTWQLMLLRQLARKNPDLPPDDVFGDLEMDALHKTADEVQKKPSCAPCPS